MLPRPRYHDRDRSTQGLDLEALGGAHGEGGIGLLPHAEGEYRAD